MVGPTNIELEKGGVEEGGAVELRFVCGERQGVVYVLEEGRR